MRSVTRCCGLAVREYQDVGVVEVEERQKPTKIELFLLIRGGGKNMVAPISLLCLSLSLVIRKIV